MINATKMCLACGRQEVPEYGCRQRGENITACVERLSWWNKWRFRDYPPAEIVNLVVRILRGVER